MFWGAPLLDFALMCCMVSILKSYFFLEDLNDEEKRLVVFSKTGIRILIVLSLVLEIGYVVGSDIGLFNGKYYLYCLGAYFVTFYLCALWENYIDYKYGPKDKEYKESLKIRVQAAVILLVIVLLMYVFR